MTDSDKYFYEFGGFRMSVSEGILLHNGSRVPLPPKAFDLLLVLIRRRPEVLSKRELLDEVWPSVYVEKCNVERQVSDLRKALGVSPEGTSYIRTIPKRGYQFISPATEWSGETITGNSRIHRP